MKIFLVKNHTLLCLAILLAGTHNVYAQTCESAGIDVPQGFVEVAPTQTAASWPTQYAPVQAPWNGGIQSGCTVTPKTNVEVLLYRAWGGGGNASYASRLGGWWSLQNPSAEYTDVDEWRAENAVCATFNTATTITKCTLKSGTQVIIGYTQSIYNPSTLCIS